MSSVINQLTTSNLSLDGTQGLSARTFGHFPQPSPIDGQTPTSLHRDYSIFGNPANTNVRDFNGSTFNKVPSTLDETDPIALGKAVIEAKKLGLTLEQIDKIGDSLLNWESSIESTLKAELLTGRQLNLERARAAALTGNQSDLMKEISEQIGTQKDFANLNVLAQRSLAEAFGLSRDEMSEMLLKQQLLNSYGKDAAKLNQQQFEEQQKSGLSMGEYLAQQAKQMEMQEQFNKSLEDIFHGETREVPVSDGSTISVRIPSWAEQHSEDYTISSDSPVKAVSNTAYRTNQSSYYGTGLAKHEEMDDIPVPAVQRQAEIKPQAFTDDELKKMKQLWKLSNSSNNEY